MIRLNLFNETDDLAPDANAVIIGAFYKKIQSPLPVNTSHIAGEYLKEYLVAAGTTDVITNLDAEISNVFESLMKPFSGLHYKRIQLDNARRCEEPKMRELIEVF